MKKYLGKGVYGAVAIGKISVFKKCDAAVTRIHVEDTEKEKQRVKAAKGACRKTAYRNSRKSTQRGRRNSRTDIRDSSDDA